MNVSTSLPPAQGSKNSTRVVPFRTRAPLPWIARHLGPHQSRGLGRSNSRGYRIGPPTCGGTAVIGEATTATATRIAPGNKASLLKGTNRQTPVENTS